MSGAYDDDVLLLRRTADSARPAEIERYLSEVPGAVREEDTWLLPQLPDREPVARVRVFPDGDLEIDPCGTSIGIARAHKFVAWLLSRGPWRLNVRGVDIGTVEQSADIYQEQWWDPDHAEDPTGSPPKRGWLVMLRREEPPGRGEYVAVHSDGAMSYERRRGEEAHKLYRRILPELRQPFENMVEALPRDRDQPGPDGDFVDPAYLSIETPTERDDIMIDAARIGPAFRQVVELMDGWRIALARDQEAVPRGLTSSMQEGEVLITAGESRERGLAPIGVRFRHAGTGTLPFAFPAAGSYVRLQSPPGGIFFFEVADISMNASVAEIARARLGRDGVIGPEEQVQIAGGSWPAIAAVSGQGFGRLAHCFVRVAHEHGAALLEFALTNRGDVPPSCELVLSNRQMKALAASFRLSGG